MLNWGNRFGICCFMDSQTYPDAYSRYDCLLAAGAVRIFSPQQNVLSQLKSFAQQQKDWLFGHISYDVKNEIDGLYSAHPDAIQFPILFFFQPETVVTLKANTITIESIDKNPDDIHQQIQQEQLVDCYNKPGKVALQSRISKKQYMAVIEKLQQHILRGDCYEINFCQEFFCRKQQHSALTGISATYASFSNSICGLL